DEAHMVMIEGEDGAVITGAIVWEPEFKRSEGYRQTPVATEYDLFHADRATMYATTDAEVWMGDLPRDGRLYEFGLNPFLVMNLHALSWVPFRDSYPKILDPKLLPHLDRDEHLRRRGEMFADGRRLKQVVRYYELYEQEDVFFVDETYKRLHFHLKDNQDPTKCRLEITLKEQGFMPDTPGLGYIYFKNIAFEKFANPIKCPQYGALSANCGHHFIIEGCRFSDIHSIGLDLGFLGHNFMHDGIRGHHIVRGNRFERCGISGMAAVPTMGYYMENMLVENNVLLDNGYLNFELLYESSAIKSHFTKDSLYRNNYIRGMKGAGIWLDNHNCNTRVCGNVLLDIRGCSHGAIFNEATLNTVMIDHNLVAGVGCHDELGKRLGGHAIYEHHCENTVVLENICLNTEAEAIHFMYTTPATNRRWMYDESVKRTAMNRDNVAIGNLVLGCTYGLALSGPHDKSDRNCILGASATQCITLWDSAAHSRESLFACFGSEGEDSPVVAMTYENGTLSLTTRTGKAFTLAVGPTARVLPLFQSIHEAEKE
ncbi:MAG: right-handed parallel beta-helix repeat-containing protein, partial [Clostridia bacterium]|nr:right-handed parallel beta-helix repeat-containing protein [Clostridia bacterium]